MDLNRPFPNYLRPLFRSESWCSSFHMQINFTYIFSADISPEMLKRGRVFKVKVLFLVLVFVLILAYSNVFVFSAAILMKGFIDM